jgi:hypothetical protein
MASAWASQGLSVSEVSQELGVTSKSVNERVRNGYRENWKSIERITIESGEVHFFIRDHGYLKGDQLELSDIFSGEDLIPALNARWQVQKANSDSFTVDLPDGLPSTLVNGGRVRRLLTIRTTSYRRPDLGRAMRLCHPADVAAIKKLMVPPALTRGNLMSQTVDAPVDSQPPSGGIFEDKPFYRIAKLPTYVFAMINEMRAKARAAGLDVIDLGMGNPDGATPKAVVAKLNEASKDRRNHRYSVSKGIWRLREAICQRYEHTYGVSGLNYEKDAIVTMGVKDSLAHLISAVVGNQVFAWTSVAIRNGAVRTGPYSST